MEKQNNDTALTARMETIRFKRNFNNKLQCDYFTTIRLKSNKYTVGKVLKVILEQNGVLRSVCDVRVVDARPLRIHQVTDWISLLDAGMQAGALMDTMYYQYKEVVGDIHTAEFVYLLLEKVKVKPVQQQLF